MDENITTQIKSLPRDLYNREGWLNSLTKYYCGEKKVLPERTAKTIFSFLVKSIENITYLNCYFPNEVYKFLQLTIDPLYDPDDFKKNIYEKINQIAEDNKTKTKYSINYLITAESLYFIRRLYQQDTKFLLKEFPNEIALMPQKTNEEKLAAIAGYLQKITKAHIVQVIAMVKPHI